MQAITRMAFAIGLITFLTESAMAHPGHGHDAYPQGVMHVVTSPWHLLPWLASGLTLVSLLVGRNVLRRRNANRKRVVAPRQR